MPRKKKKKGGNGTRPKRTARATRDIDVGPNAYKVYRKIIARGGSEAEAFGALVRSPEFELKTTTAAKRLIKRVEDMIRDYLVDAKGDELDVNAISPERAGTVARSAALKKHGAKA